MSKTAHLCFLNNKLVIRNITEGTYWNLSGQGWVGPRTASRFTSTRLAQITLARINGGWYQ